MKLTTTTQVSVDGVVQGNGGRHPDLDGGFERGGWARPLFDSEAVTFVDQVYQRADAFLFGRRTYELFAGYWGVREDLGNPIVGALNTKPKYVASTTLTDPKWSDTTVLSGDLAAAIGELKAKPAGELQVHGSGALTRWLLENDLVDEMNLLIVPVVVGQGTRLFPDTGPDMALDLVESRAFPKGITIQVYRPAARSMQPTEARDIADALDERPVPAVWPRPTQVGNEKYLGGFWIIEAADLDVALEPRHRGVEGLQSEGRGAPQRCESRRPRRRPAQVSSDGFDESDRSQPAYQKVLKDIREAVSDRGRGVRSRGERPPTRGAPNHRR